MKHLFLMVSIPLCLGLVGCQTYPKNPSTPSFWDGMEQVNKTTPSELDGVRYTVVKFGNKESKSPASIDLSKDQSKTIKK